MVDNDAWWRNGIFYQIYPRSFQDFDGDGVGDLVGIIRRLPYLIELGIDAVWLSPIFPSPMADFGYDISDYTGIDPIFGTMSAFDALAGAVHEHGLKIILDLVPNHTSDRHPWFIESRNWMMLVGHVIFGAFAGYMYWVLAQIDDRDDADVRTPLA